MRMSHINKHYNLMAQATSLVSKASSVFFPVLMIRAADFPGTKVKLGEEQMENQPFQSAAGLNAEKC